MPRRETLPTFQPQGQHVSWWMARLHGVCTLVFPITAYLAWRLRCACEGFIEPAAFILQSIFPDRLLPYLPVWGDRQPFVFRMASEMRIQRRSSLWPDRTNPHTSNGGKVNSSFHSYWPDVASIIMELIGTYRSDKLLPSKWLSKNCVIPRHSCWIDRKISILERGRFTGTRLPPLQPRL